jgi:predicted DCC family thiol-disulfide oxidoreductase YuxK
MVGTVIFSPEKGPLAPELGPAARIVDETKKSSAPDEVGTKVLPSPAGIQTDGGLRRSDNGGRQPIRRIGARHRAEPWVIIDGDCSFCTSSTNWLGDRLHRAGHPDARRVPYQFLDLASFGLTEERTRREMIWVPAGDVPADLAGGDRAFAAWLRYAGGPAALVGRLISSPPLRPVARIAYGWVSRNRHRLPGGTPACALPPQADG